MLEPVATAVGAASEVKTVGSSPTHIVWLPLIVFAPEVDNTLRLSVAELVHPAEFSITTMITLLSSKV